MPDTPRPAPPRAVRFALPALLLIAVGSLAAAVFLPVPKRKPVAESAPAELPPRPVPAFAMTNRDGTTVTNTDLRGNVWVAAFVFTRCTQTCPQVTGTLYRLQTDLDLAGRPDLRFVSFSMDPEFDKPPVLQNYAADPARPAKSDRWLYLSGSAADVPRVMKDGFQLAFAPNPDAPDAGLKYSHGTYIYLVDKQGLIRGHYDGIRGVNDTTGERYADGLARLKGDVDRLLAE